MDAGAVLLVGKVNKGFIQHEADIFLTAPLGQAKHIRLGDIIAGGVIGIDKDEVLDRMDGEKGHEVVRRIAIIGIIRGEYHLLAAHTMGILLEGRAHHTGGALHLFH